jgi:cation transport ATPase
MHLLKFKISGMTCSSCSLIIKDAFKNFADDKNISINHIAGEGFIESENKIKLTQLSEALKVYQKYTIEHFAEKEKEQEQSWFGTYKPVFLLFFYITILSFIVGFKSSVFDFHLAMNTFMAGFFIAFSYFKLLNLKAFANSYSMYDIIAKKIKSWGYIYAFIEFLLGILYALNIKSIYLNGFTAILMSLSLIGVLISVLNKKKIQCACLGTVFNLPMSTVTIIEDSLMIIMSLGMLFLI